MVEVIIIGQQKYQIFNIFYQLMKIYTLSPLKQFKNIINLVAGLTGLTRSYDITYKAIVFSTPDIIFDILKFDLKSRQGLSQEKCSQVRILTGPPPVLFN